jgi:hypothetical protein
MAKNRKVFESEVNDEYVSEVDGFLKMFRGIMDELKSQSEPVPRLTELIPQLEAYIGGRSPFLYSENETGRKLVAALKKTFPILDADIPKQDLLTFLKQLPNL